ncbi:chromogranin-A isoform X2 [Hoplias malabaricus]|uniref:chromogranin-A isoform X2 n=1 Tax=Hoplias malabaricus TaxID=27720 RepID=UPI0034636124
MDFPSVAAVMGPRSCLVLMFLIQCVFSIPVSVNHMDKEDVQVMKCIVEVLTDVLSKPHSLPISQHCLQTLRTDDRLVTVLRHSNFLQELQDIAVEGANERSEKQMKDSVDYVMNHPEDPEATADRSMLVAMKGAGKDREEKRSEEEVLDGQSEERDQKTQKLNEFSSQEKMNTAEENSNAKHEEEEHILALMKKGGKEDEEEKLSSTEEEEDEAPGAGDHSEVKKSADEDEEEKEEEEEKEGKSGAIENRKEGPGQIEEDKARAGLKPWSRSRLLTNRRADMNTFDQQEVPHHSKEALGVGVRDGEVWKSPEEQELQMMVRREPEDRREEEGSASKKTEDAEIESLAAIESELENVAQKLHELRRG